MHAREIISPMSHAGGMGHVTHGPVVWCCVVLSSGETCDIRYASCMLPDLWMLGHHMEMSRDS